MSDRDAELLDQYVRGGSEDAFAEIARRYVNLVHGAAQRQLVGANHLADDVTQAVFIVLARKARKVRGDHLAGWLLNTTRFCVAEAKRRQKRRQFHEHRAASMKPTTIENSQSSDQEIYQYLDEAIGCLPPRQSTAIAMRYLQNKSTPEVAAAMGISTDAAQKIILRGMPKLRRILTGRGVTLSSTAGLAEVMLQTSRHVAPMGLQITGHSTGVGLTIAKGAMRILVLNKMQVAGAVAVVTLIAGSGTALLLTHHDGKAITAATVPISAGQTIPARLQSTLFFQAYTSPFLEMQGCRIKQKVHLAISAENPISQHVRQHLGLLAVTNPPVHIFEKEALELSWNVDPTIAERTDHYRVTLASEDDGATRNIDAPIELNRQADSPQFRMDAPVPSPGNYYVHIQACDKAENTIAQSSVPVVVQPLIWTDIEISDINANGRLLCYGVLQRLNDTDAAIKQDSISNSGNVRVSMMDEKGRPLAITPKPERGGVRYFYTFNEPIQPGQWEFISGNAETKVPIARKIGRDEWDFTATYGGNEQPMRRVNLLRLPAGAQFVSSKTTGLQHKMVDGREQLFLDSMLKVNENVLVSFRYRLAGP
ncbi:MAG TPA: sigma-70 family RNA polymerase sigma factor [Tepidisphaeraceae bacterium]|jgi:RNA polymerase sigma factor (sigma-70 family)